MKHLRLINLKTLISVNEKELLIISRISVKSVTLKVINYNMRLLT